MENIPVIVLGIIIVYFLVLYFISVFISRKNSDNEAFFLGNRQSKWWVVSVGMIGSSISGVTFVSVPGWVRESDMTYMQMVIGFFFGYIVVAFLLLPLYYKLNLTSIYSYLGQRFGRKSMKTGSCFFILSRLTGSAAKLYLIIMVLQSLVFSHWGIPFYVTVIGTVILIWLYTYRSGVKTIIWTDFLQTCFFIIALILIIYQVAGQLDLNFSRTVEVIQSSKHSRIFIFDDWGSKQNFVKQFLSGIFIVIVMTGLDQDMMQKNLSCKNLKDAKKNMLSYGIMFIPINLLFLGLGVLLLYYADQKQIILPEISDQILPFLAEQYLGLPVLIFFVIGIIGASFSSADSALTSITTSVCVDLLEINKEGLEQAKSTRIKVHILISILFGFIILSIGYLGEKSIVNAIYKIASYTYGPLLGLFSLGLFSKVQVKDKVVPYVCLASPLLCYATEVVLHKHFSYVVGYELLMLNGLLTLLGLLLIRSKNDKKLSGESPIH